MLKEYKTQAILGVWGGFFFFALGYLIGSAQDGGFSFFGRLIMAGGYLLFVCGCFMYARGKGRNWFWGGLGLLGPVGLLLLYCLKDRAKMVLKMKRRNDSLI